MRRGLFAVPRRNITGVAPTIFIPKQAPQASVREAQIDRNTKITLELLKLQKGPVPAPYTRKYNSSIGTLTTEIEELLGSAEKLRRDVKDNEPLDKIGAMERALRHALWSYLKDEGDKNFPEMERWLIYTATDQQRLTELRQHVERNEKYASFRKQHASSTVPAFNLTEEYTNVVDREGVVEKRTRYDTLSTSAFEQDQSQVDKLKLMYSTPKQQQRLDRICQLLERFRPILAREAIMQRLTVKHLEGKLGLWRYLDWNPEVRDRAELEADHYCQQWWYTNEEKRLSQIRLRSKQELNEIAERNQSKATSASQQGAGGALGGSSKDAVTAAREKLLQEIVRLQSRVGSKVVDDEKGSEDAKKIAGNVASEEKQIKISEDVITERGLIGLDFIGSESAKAKATA